MFVSSLLFQEGILSFENAQGVLKYFNRLDSSVGRASAFGAGGRGFESRGRTIPKV